jgi:hypothetical protein
LEQGGDDPLVWKQSIVERAMLDQEEEPVLAHILSAREHFLAEHHAQVLFSRGIGKPLETSVQIAL